MISDDDFVWNGLCYCYALLLIITFACLLARSLSSPNPLPVFLCPSFVRLFFFLDAARWKVFTSILLCCTSSKDYMNVSSINNIVKLFSSSYDCYKYQVGKDDMRVSVWIYMLFRWNLHIFSRLVFFFFLSFLCCFCIITVGHFFLSNQRHCQAFARTTLGDLLSKINLYVMYTKMYTLQMLWCVHA